MTVPHRYLLVWSGQQFPALARLSVDSVLAADPDARVEIFAFEPFPTGERFWSMAADERVTIFPSEASRVFEALPADLGAHCEAAFEAIPASFHSARSNLLRYALLYTRGGVYIDFDAIVLRPLTQIAGGRDFVGEERVWRHDEARVNGDWRLTMAFGTVAWGIAWLVKRLDGLILGGRMRSASLLRPLDRYLTRLQPNNAVIGATQGSEFIRAVLSRIKDQDPSKRYSLGPHLIRDVVIGSDVVVISEDVMYPVPPAESYRWFEDETLALGTGAAVIHYCSSNHRKLLSNVTFDDRRFNRSRAPLWVAGRPLACSHQSEKELVDA